MEMKERVELLRLQAIRGPEVACGPQKTLFSAGSKSHRDSGCFSCFLHQNRDFEASF